MGRDHPGPAGRPDRVPASSSAPTTAPSPWSLDPANPRGSRACSATTRWSSCPATAHRSGSAAPRRRGRSQPVLAPPVDGRRRPGRAALTPPGLDAADAAPAARRPRRTRVQPAWPGCCDHLAWLAARTRRCGAGRCCCSRSTATSRYAASAATREALVEIGAPACPRPAPSPSAAGRDGGEPRGAGAAHAAATYPGTFGGLFCQSGSFFLPALRRPRAALRASTTGSSTSWPGLTPTRRRWPACEVATHRRAPARRTSTTTAPWPHGSAAGVAVDPHRGPRRPQLHRLARPASTRRWATARAGSGRRSTVPEDLEAGASLRCQARLTRRPDRRPGTDAARRAVTASGPWPRPACRARAASSRTGTGAGPCSSSRPRVAARVDLEDRGIIHALAEPIEAGRHQGLRRRLPRRQHVVRPLARRSRSAPGGTRRYHGWITDQVAPAIHGDCGGAVRHRDRRRQPRAPSTP